MRRILKEPYYLTLLALGYIWFKSGLTKLIDGHFAENLDNTLANFNKGNPYPIVKSFLENIAIPNAYVFGILTIVGELFIGIVLIFGVIILIAKKIHNNLFNLLLIFTLAAAALLNLNYWLSSGWISPSSDSINLLMFFIEVIGLAYFITINKSIKSPY